MNNNKLPIDVHGPRAAITVLSLVFCVSCATSSSTRGTDAIYVDIGEPRHWTLDDAHYLLAGSHQRARSLEIVKPGTLDPNSFQSSRIEQIRTAVDVAVAVDEIAEKKNEVAAANLDRALANAQRANADLAGLEQKRTELRDQLLVLERQRITQGATVTTTTAELKLRESRRTELVGKRSAAEEEEPVVVEKLAELDESIESLDGEIEALRLAVTSATVAEAATQAEIEAVNKQLEFVAEDIQAAEGRATVSEPSLTNADLSAVPGASAGTGASADVLAGVTDALKSSEGFTGSLVPKFNVSDSLANYVDAENELMARQLTMLRDEIGVDRTLVFLELPHSIHSTKRRSKYKQVQLTWSVDSYCTGDPFAEADRLAGAFASLHSKTLLDEGVGLQYWPDGAENTAGQASPQAEEVDASLRQWLDNTELLATERIVTASKNRNEARYRKVWEAELRKTLRRKLRNRAFLVDRACEGGLPAAEDRIAAWDLIPKVNAYNRAEYTIRDSEVSIGFILSRLTGIGASARANRRRQLFEQFATQDVLASAYGMGNTFFGWVLGAKPGTNIVPSGAKTTYAVLSVPKEATAIRLVATHCVLGRHEVLDPECGTSQSEAWFEIPIQKTKEFWVERIDFGRVMAGTPVSMIVSGHGFSPFQLAVMVDGVPLSKYSGLASESRALARGAQSGNGPVGFFEVTDSETVVINFAMPTDYVGTPEITLVTPAKSSTLNFLDVELGVLGGQVASLRDLARDPMFQRPLAITSTAVSKKKDAQSKYTVSFSGSGLTGATKARVLAGPSSARVPSSDIDFRVLSDNEAKLKVPDASEWSVTLSKELASTNDAKTVTIKRPKPTKPPSMQWSEVVVLDSRSVDDETQRLSIRLSGKEFPKDASLDAIAGTGTIRSAYWVSKTDMRAQVETDSDEVLLALTNGTSEIRRVVPVPRAPVVASISSSCGRRVGGDEIRVTGRNLQGVSKLLFGGHPAQIVTRSDDSLLVITPPGEGRVSIVAESSRTVGGVRLSSIESQEILGFEYSTTDCETPLFRFGPPETE